MNKVFLAGLILQALFLSSLACAELPPEFFSTAARFILRSTPAGKQIVGSLTLRNSEEATEVVYQSFVQRVNWGKAAPLRAELETSFSSIDAKFEAYRVEKGRAAKMSADDVLTADERQWLLKESETLNANPKIQAATQDAVKRIDAFAEVRDPAVSSGAVTAAEVVEEFATLDLRKLKLSEGQRLMSRARAFKNFIKAIVISKAQLKSLLGMSGRLPTAQDVEILRKNNGILDGLSQYAQDRFVIEAMVHEDAAAYTLVNAATRRATREFMTQVADIEGYLAARKAAAQSVRPPLNDVVWEAEKRIIHAIDQCEKLGGKLVGNQLTQGKIEIAHENIVRLGTQIANSEANIRELNFQLIQASQLERRAIRSKILLEQANLDVRKLRLSRAVEAQEDNFIKFIHARELLEIPANIRIGLLNSQPVQPFDLPDPFVVAQEQLNAWKVVFKKAYDQSTDLLMREQVDLFMRTRIGETRKFVRDMNKLTSKVSGKLFTESDRGAHLQEYGKHLAVANLGRLATALKIVIPAAVIERMSNDVIKEAWDWLFNEDDTTHPAP